MLDETKKEKMFKHEYSEDDWRIMETPMEDLTDEEFERLQQIMEAETGQRIVVVGDRK